MQHDKLKTVLKNHAEWVENPANGERANLRWAYLQAANLQDADLRGADLRGADLRGADLEGSHINHCVGNMREIRSLQLDTWAIAFTADTMAIGCEQHAIGDWWAFDDERIARMDRQALTWWRTWKPILQQIVAVTRSPDSRSQPSDATGT